MTCSEVTNGKRGSFQGNRWVDEEGVGSEMAGCRKTQEQ